jgi:hypothetical protein
LFGSNAVDVKNAKRNEQPRHHCLGVKYDITSISPENIAYAAVVVSNNLPLYQISVFTHSQARFCLSSKRIWNLTDDQFHYREFYQAIVTQLADGGDPWVQKTLAWWNE